MATYTLDIAGMTTSSNLSANSWTKQGGTLGDFVVTDDAGSVLGKKLVFNGTEVRISWDAVGADADRDDLELLVIAEMNIAAAEDAHCGTYTHGSGSQFLRYRLGHSGADYYENIQAVDTGNNDDFEFSNEPITDPGTTRQAIRIRYNAPGLTCQVKRWDYGGAEPGTWDSFDLDSGDGVAALAVGYVAIFSQPDVTTYSVEFISAGTNGDTAPSPADSTTAAKSYYYHAVGGMR